jgi:hypothetical protein
VEDDSGYSCKLSDSAVVSMVDGDSRSRLDEPLRTSGGGMRSDVLSAPDGDPSVLRGMRRFARGVDFTFRLGEKLYP